MKVLIKKIGNVDVPIPQYQTQGSAGLDLCAAISEPLLLKPGERVLVPSGLAMSIPYGYEGQIRPRSGLALKNGISIVNSPGTIDSDYIGQISIILINHNDKDFVIEPLSRIAQIVFAPVAQANLELVNELNSTARGVGGFGSTG